MCSDQDIVWFITTPKYLNESDLSIAVEFTLRETSSTSLSLRELPKITKLHLEIFRNI